MTTGDHVGEDPTGGRAAAPGASRVHPVIAGLGITLGGQLLVALGTVLLYRLIAQRMGTEGFASFSLAKQAVTLLFPVVTVGLVGGLPRALALTRRGEGPRPEELLAAAAAICGTVAVAGAAIAVAIPGATAEVFFGGTASPALVRSAAGLLIATAAFHVAYGYFRGRQRLGVANLLQVLAAGLIPPLLLVLFPDLGVASLVALMALALGGLSLAFVLKPLARGLLAGRAGLERAGRPLLDYGGRRVPGEIAQVALFALVPVIAAHVTSLEQVAYLAAALQLVAMLAVALNPIGVVLLPSLAERWSVDPERTARQVGALAGFAAHVAIFAAIQLFVMAELALRLWLGPNFADAGALVRVTLLAAGPFIFYLSMRSSLDAVAVRSYNTRSNLAGLMAFILVASILLAVDGIQSAFAVAWAFAAGVCVQGFSTLAYVQRAFRVSLSAYAIVPALGLGLAAGAAAWLVRPVIEDAPAPLVLLIGAELLLAAGFFGGLGAARVEWIALLRARGLRR